MIRVGIGYDVHQLESGDGLIMGGINIPYHQSFIAHSDGDVLIHAICDALLGALALGDIGQHFPPSDSKYSNIASVVLLQEVYEKIKQHHYQLVNLDTVIICEAPKLMSYIRAMRENLAKYLAVEIDKVAIKATTTERLGFVGRKEGIAAQAIVSLLSNRT